MRKLNLILFFLFVFLLHFNITYNEKCAQQLRDEIFIEEKEPEAMCGLNDEQNLKRIDIFKRQLDKFKQILLDDIPKERPYEKWDKVYCNMFELHAPTLALAIKQERDDCWKGHQISPKFEINCRKKDTYRYTLGWSWSEWCIDYVTRQTAPYWMGIYLEGCISPCILNNRISPNKVTYKFHYAKQKPNWNTGSFKIKPIDDANIVNQNFNFYFFVHNLYTAEYSRLEHLKNELCHSSNFERIIKPFESGVICYDAGTCVAKKAIVGAFFSFVGGFLPQALLNPLGSCDEGYLPTFSDENIPKPEADYPNKHNPYIILEHNCTLGGSSLYQLIRLSEVNVGGKEKSIEKRDIQIELKTKADDKYTFDTLEKLQLHKMLVKELHWPFGKAGKDIVDVITEGEAAIKEWVVNAGFKYNVTAKIPKV